MSRAIAGAVLAASLLVAACGSTGASPAPSTVASAPALASAAPLATAAAASPAASTAPVGSPVARDPGLLAVLPATVGGVSVTEEPEAFKEALGDAAFAQHVDRAVFAIAVSPSDLASGVVAHLRPGVYSDQFFADWRTSYDEGACGQAGGAVAHAESTTGGRTTYVTTCGGGMRVYHTHLAGPDVVVSLLSVGKLDLGAQLLAGVKG